MEQADITQMDSDLPGNKLNDFNTRRWFIIAFSIFLAAGILGLTMRYIFIGEVPFLKYQNVMHTHSHIALMGWAFMLVSGGIIYFFNEELHLGKVIRNTLFLNTISVIGMTITFILQGYAFESIAFSTLHLVVAFYFGINVLRKLKSSQKSTSHRFLRWSIYWYMLSSLGLLAIGPVSSMLGQLHPLYSGSIQFFLHFQFNGWFTFGALALVFKFIEDRDHNVYFSTPIWIVLITSVLLTYLLSVTWSTPLDVLFYLNAAGVVLQGIAYGSILNQIIKHLKSIKFNFPLVRTLIILGLGSLTIKVIIQMAVVIPFIAVISYTIHNYVVAFIHLIMLGSITFTIAALLVNESALPYNKTAIYGWSILAFGFILTEFILFGQGTLLWIKFGFIPGYYEVLFGSSTLLPIGIALILLSFRRKRVLKTTG